MTVLEYDKAIFAIEGENIYINLSSLLMALHLILCNILVLHYSDKMCKPWLKAGNCSQEGVQECLTYLAIFLAFTL